MTSWNVWSGLDQSEHCLHENWNVAVMLASRLHKVQLQVCSYDSPVSSSSRKKAFFCIPVSVNSSSRIVAQLFGITGFSTTTFTYSCIHFSENNSLATPLQSLKLTYNRGANSGCESGDLDSSPQSGVQYLLHVFIPPIFHQRSAEKFLKGKQRTSGYLNAHLLSPLLGKPWKTVPFSKMNESPLNWRCRIYQYKSFRIYAERFSSYNVHPSLTRYPSCQLTYIFPSTSFKLQ